MSQGSVVIADGSGSAVLTAINAANQALITNNSGASAPATTYAYMTWADTSSGFLKIRDAANSTWIIVGSLADLGIQSSNQIVATAGGTADALTATFAPAVTTLSNGIILYIRAGSANATTAPTLSVNGLVAKTIVKGNGIALVPGDIAGAGHWIEVQYDTTFGQFVLLNPATGVAVVSTVPRSAISGLTLSTAGASTTMSIAAGQAADSGNVVLMSLAASINKTTSAWAVGSGNGGLDTGSIAASTWYYFYAIRRPDTGVVDVVFSLSSSAPTLPTSYTQYRYIGAGFTNGSSQWTKFTQFGDSFAWDTPVLDYNTTGSTTAALQALTVPRGRKMLAQFNLYVNQDTNQCYISDPANSDLAPSLTAAPLASFGFTSASFAGTTFGQCWTNTSAQIRHREANGTGTVRIATLGWTDLRGKDL